MKPYKRTIREVFNSDVLYEVPRYQRPYVWQRETHWELLWGDIEGLVDDYVAGKDRRHFLGAVVLQQDDAAPGGVTRWRVIDGQQRLTTLQIVLAAAAVAAGESGADQPKRLFRRLVENDPDVATDGEEQLKLSPTLNDRETFHLVLRDGGPPVDAPDNPDNTIQEAFGYFLDTIRAWALDGGPEQEDLLQRYKVLYAVIGDLVQMVSINLESDDDAQIIFETLNARGTPLLAIELVKNAVLDRARRQGDDPDELHDKEWAPELGRPYWRKEVRQGRLRRPRAENFLGHWLTMKLRQEVGAGDLFGIFRARLLDGPEAPPASELIVELRRDAEIMRGFEEAEPSSPTGQFFRVMDALDTSTFHPLALRLFTAKGLSSDRRDRALAAVESFLVRRMLLGLTSKAYNRLVLDLLKAGAGKDEVLDEVVINGLAASGADSVRWPIDSAVKDHLSTQGLYRWLGQRKIRLLLSEIELRRRRHAKVEDIYELPKLSIEHVLPVEWRKHWPVEEATDEVIERRESSLHLLGNLTLVTGQLNSAMSNQAWAEKRKRLGETSLLLLNREFADADTWGEAEIDRRGQRLASEICERWPGPAEFEPNYVPPDAGPPRERHPEAADMALEDVQRSYDGGSKYFRQLLLELSRHPDEPRRFSSVEDALGWSHGILASVLGGYGNRAAVDFDKRRPYRIGQDEDNRWWIWLEAERAKLIRRRSDEPDR